MTETSINNIKACVFDAYGTLFDVHSAVGKHKNRLGDKADAISLLWRQKQLEYTWLRTLMRDHADFWQLTRDALAYALEAHGVADKRLEEDLLNAYLELSCYPEVPAMLQTLQQRGFGLGILSNGEPGMLEAAISNAGLTSLFDHAISIEDIGIYKPDPRVYQLACDRFSAQPHEICFMSSNAWDVAGAAHFGFSVVWINRFNQPTERLSGKPKAMLSDLKFLPELIKG